MSLAATRPLLAASAGALFLLAGCTKGPAATSVRATLDDGQVLMGSVQTPILQLETGFGIVDVPLGDIGEVQPVEGGALGGSGNHVSVWLRNGSELRGEWTEPQLQMGLSIDDRQVPVDLPMRQLERFQLQGGDLLPAGIVYRVHTVYGDDFVVDADQTWVRIDNALGSFRPTLGEVLSLKQHDGSLASLGASPAATGVDWRMQLATGTVLIGDLAGTGADAAALELALPLGPDRIAVPIDDIVSIERQDWGGYSSWKDDTVYRPAEAEQAAPAAGSGGRWFDNRRQRDFKQNH